MQNEKIINKALELIKKADKDGITAYKISSDIGITENTIRNYIKGKTKPTLANARMIIDYFAKSGNINVTGDGNITNTGITGGNVVINSQDEINQLKKKVKELQRENNELKNNIYEMSMTNSKLILEITRRKR